MSELKNDRDAFECILSLEVFSPLDSLIAEHYLKEAIKDPGVLSRVILVVRELVTNIGKYARRGNIKVLRGPGLLEIVTQSWGKKEARKGLGLGLEIVKKNASEIIFREDKNGEAVTVVVRMALSSLSSSGWKIGLFNKSHFCEEVGGDIALWREEGGTLRVLVADVLGHGERAFLVAQQMRPFFEKERAESLAVLYSRLHDLLKATRGCMLFLAIMRRECMEYLLMGNLRAWLKRGSGFKSLMGGSGVVGRVEINPTFQREPLVSASRLIVCTDGIESRFHPQLFPWVAGLTPERVAQQIGKYFSRKEDDACVLVVEGPESSHPRGQP